LKPLTTINKPSIALSNSIPIQQIGFDFDGVIADTAEVFIRLACEKYDYCSFTKESITNFELEHCIDIPAKLVEQIFTDILLDSVGNNLRPMSGAVRTLYDIAQNGEVTIITARPVQQPVTDWLHLYFDDKTVEKFHIVATGDHNDKVRHIHDHGIRYFVDDRAATCLQLATEDITPIVFSHPWNSKRHNLQSVDNWDDIRELIDIP